MSQNLNNIQTTQNTPSNLDYIAAASYYYSKAKLLLGFQIVCTVVIPAIFALIAIFKPGFRVWASTYGVSISIIDAALFDKFQKDLKKNGAEMQECFDCAVQEHPWNSVKVGDRPTVNLKVPTAAKKYKNKTPDQSKIKDWYSPILSNLPLPLARIACQRTNIWWDVTLRNKYKNWLVIIMTSLVVGIGIVGLAKDLKFTDFILSVLNPVTPMVLWTIKEWRKQTETIDTLQRLTKFGSELWKKGVEGTYAEKELAAESRTLQDELFVHRYSNQPIFQSFYKLSRTNLEEDVNVTAEKLVEEWQQKKK